MSRSLLPLFLLLSVATSAQVQNLPDFTFKKMAEGTDFSKRDIPAGKKVFFMFFDVTCPHCQRTITELNRRQKELSGPNIFLVTMDKKDEVAAFREKYGKELFRLRNVTLLYDGQRQFISRFLPKMFPAMYLFNPQGGLLLYSNEEKDVDQIIRMFHS
jgi:peroxiredoxin